MKNIVIIIILLSGMLFMIPGCSVGKKGSDAGSKKEFPESGLPQAVAVPEGNPVGGSAMVLKATAFRMNGDYSNNVGITLDNKGNLLYYPAPTDITANSRPVNLGSGWWLNRQGISDNSVFLKYTFEEYSRLENVPSREELKKMIIPDSHVTGFRQLPYSASEAMGHLNEIKKYLRQNP